MQLAAGLLKLLTCCVQLQGERCRLGGPGLTVRSDDAQVGLQLIDPVVHLRPVVTTADDVEGGPQRYQISVVDVAHDVTLLNSDDPSHVSKAIDLVSVRRAQLG
ncbi:MAG: hypothetical protein ACRDSN_17420, partial [Pseudonocardiaceae bacterium]